MRLWTRGWRWGKMLRMELVLGFAHHTGVRLAEVGFLLVLFAGVWLAAAQLPQFKFGTTRTIVAGVFCVQVDFVAVDRAVGMRPFVELPSSERRTRGSCLAGWEDLTSGTDCHRRQSTARCRTDPWSCKTSRLTQALGQSAPSRFPLAGRLRRQPEGAGNPICGHHAAALYSWMRPPGVRIVRMASERKHIVERRGELAVAVVDQKADRLLALDERLDDVPCLLGRSLTCRVRGDARQIHLPG
jgi:hypothetical protein